MNEFNVEVSVTFEVNVTANSMEEAMEFIGRYSVEEMLIHQRGNPDIEMSVTNGYLESPKWIS